MKQIEECMTIHKLLQNAPFKVEFVNSMTGKCCIGSKTTDIHVELNPKLDNRDIIINLIRCIAFCYLFKNEVERLDITHEEEEALELLTSNVKTNLGEMPLVDYLDFIVQPTGYDDYVKYLEAGYCFENYKTITTEIVSLKECLDNAFEYLVLDDRECEYITYLVLNELNYSTDYYLENYRAEVQQYDYNSQAIVNQILELL